MNLPHDQAEIGRATLKVVYPHRYGMMVCVAALAGLSVCAVYGLSVNDDPAPRPLGPLLDLFGGSVSGLGVLMCVLLVLALAGAYYYVFTPWYIKSVPYQDGEEPGDLSPQAPVPIESQEPRSTVH